jgi:hypothetical protein
LTEQRIFRFWVGFCGGLPGGRLGRDFQICAPIGNPISSVEGPRSHAGSPFIADIWPYQWRNTPQWADAIRLSYLST